LCPGGSYNGIECFGNGSRLVIVVEIIQGLRQGIVFFIFCQSVRNYRKDNFSLGFHFTENHRNGIAEEYMLTDFALGTSQAGGDAPQNLTRSYCGCSSEGKDRPIHPYTPYSGLQVNILLKISKI
jgi:hypothetical protein